ncbi:hypothetical protein N7535_003351 [Penicillium sp. DV-2018c]|nr:hypothetical protein N7535_003351 [Penicillium sp. DV-2018c]
MSRGRPPRAFTIQRRLVVPGGPLGSGLRSGPISSIDRQLTSSRGTTYGPPTPSPGSWSISSDISAACPPTLGIPSGQVAGMHHDLPAPGGPPGGHQSMSPGSWSISSDISAGCPTNTGDFIRAGGRDASCSTSSWGSTTVHQRHPPGAGQSLPTSRRPAPPTLGISPGQAAEMHHALPAPGGPPGGHSSDVP